MYIGENVNKFHKVELVINNRQRRAIFARHALQPRSSLPQNLPLSTHYHQHHTNTYIKPPLVHTTLGIHEPHPVTVSFTSKPWNLFKSKSTAVLSDNLMFWQRRPFRESPYVCRTFHQCCRGARLALLSLALLAPLQSEVTSA